MRMTFNQHEHTYTVLLAVLTRSVITLVHLQRRIVSVGCWWHHISTIMLQQTENDIYSDFVHFSVDKPFTNIS